MWRATIPRQRTIERLILLLVVLSLVLMAPGCDFPLLSSNNADEPPAAGASGASAGTDSADDGSDGQQIPDEAFSGDDQTGAPADTAPVRVVEAGLREPRTLNPVLVDDPLSDELSRLVFSGLVNVNPETGRPEADLANHWDISEDGTTYTFSLRDEIEWHDGEPFSANDVVFTFELMMDDRTRSPRFTRVVERVVAVEALDSHTVEFRLYSPYAPFLTTVATFGIVPEHILAGVLPEELVTDPFGISSAVGTGPFRFAYWDRGSRIVFEANPNYHRATPQYQAYEYHVAPEMSVILDGLKTGTYDWARITPEYVEDADGLEGVQTRSIPSYELITVVFQLDTSVTSVFEDPAVRRALMLALDRPAAVEEIWHGQADVAHGTLPPASPIYQQSERRYDYDPAESRRLLDEAGWALGGDGARAKDGEPLRFNLVVNGDNPMRRSLAEWLAESWREIGVDVRLRYETWSSVRERITRNRDFQSLILGYRWDIDPDQRAMWSSDATPNGFNLGGYVDADVDRMLVDALATRDEAERADIYHEVQNRVMEDLPVLPLVFPRQTVAVGPRLHETQLTAILLRNRSSVSSWVPVDRDAND